ncbi:MAG TPA: FAD-dependent oxidoreductase [Candidatus Deferrimicrobium sp.]|nr:FAD-dependent oxidoreductase [Candidatus Deferrimicrobium sp.]
MSKIVVVGGVAAGASAAVKARRTDEAAEIIMFERGSYVSWANCGLPYYVGGEIKTQADLVLVSEALFDRRFNIAVKARHEVTGIDRVNKKITGIQLDTGESFEESYDKLILAPGGRPVRPPIPGIDLNGIFTVTTIPEADKIKQYMNNKGVKKAVVIGAGFIGLETLEALTNQGLEVSLVEGTQHVLPIFDIEMTTGIHQYLRSNGVNLLLNEKVVAFGGEGTVQYLELSSGKRLETDMVILSIGVAPETKLAIEAGLTIGETGGITVSDTMQTSDPDIFAAGDAVETLHWVTGKKVRLALAGPANKQGRVAGANAVGGNMKYKGAAGSSIVRIGDMVAGKTGLAEKEALTEGIEYFVSFIHPANHAGYYPGGAGMTIKLVVEKQTGRLLGAQVIGKNGVDKRIDVFASAIYAKQTVRDLEDLDLCYAPPFASAKDPAILAGYVAGNILRGEIKTITPRELDEALTQGKQLQVVDVRTVEEFKRGHIPGAINVPLDELRQKYTELDQGKETVVNCGVGYRSYLAYKILQARGFENLLNLSGGITSWNQWDNRG